MSGNKSVQSAALPIKLQTIPVSDLTLGMVVHAIATQTGTLAVKNKGAISHVGTIEQLIANGVTSVVVESAARSSPLETTRVSTVASTLDTDTGQSAILSCAQFASPSQKHAVTRKTALADAGNVAISAAVTPKGSEQKLAFAAAAALLDTGEAIYKKFTHALAANQAIDFGESQALSASVYANLSKNPDALLCLSMVMESNDYIAKHSVHVATLICYFAQYLGCSTHECERLALVGYLFDVGMVKVPEEIRLKTGQLTDKELDEVKLHVAHSLSLLAPLKLESEYMLAIEQHHERLDGSGYPYGYVGAKIHKFSRILAIVDTYDALTTTRAHKAPLSPAKAMNVLSKPHFGYDEKLVLKFIRCMGVYPVGSLVALSNKHIGLVIKTTPGAPISPVVKIFYDISGKRFISPVVVDLSLEHESTDPKAEGVTSGNTSDTNEPVKPKLHVLRPVLASQFGIDMTQVL